MDEKKLQAELDAIKNLWQLADKALAKFMTADTDASSFFNAYMDAVRQYEKRNSKE